MKRLLILATIIGSALSEGRSEADEGFVLKAGEGEAMMNGIVAKVSPKNAETRSILVEQTFPKGGSTNLHYHQQGDELFYVVEGKGTATLNDKTQSVSEGDVIFVPRGLPHKIANLDNARPLVVVFFMDSPELVEQFRAIHERRSQAPDQPITSEEFREIERRYGGGVEVKEGELD